MEQTRQHVVFKPGTILEANDDGTFRVLPDSGRGGSRPIDGVRPVIESAFDPGDRVVLFTQRPGDHPVILVASGGSSACFSCLDSGIYSSR